MPACVDINVLPSQICTPNDTECRDNIIWQCNAEGTEWVNTGEVCTTICTPGATECRDNVLWQCNQAGTVWENTQQPCNVPPTQPNWLLIGIAAIVGIGAIALIVSGD